MNKGLCRATGHVDFEEAGFVNNFPVHITLTWYSIIKETPKGHWIEINWPGNKKWVSKTSKKRYAHPTEKEAIYSLMRRKRIQIELLTSQLKSAELVKAHCDEILEGVKDEIQR